MTPFSVPNGPLCTGVALVRLRYVQLVRVSTRHEVDFTCSQSTDGNTVVTSNEHVAYGAFQLGAIVLGREPRRGDNSKAGSNLQNLRQSAEPCPLSPRSTIDP